VRFPASRRTREQTNQLDNDDYLDILATVLLGVCEIIFVDVRGQGSPGLLTDPAMMLIEESRWLRYSRARRTLTKRATGRAKAHHAGGSVEGVSGRRRAGWWMGVIVRIGGRSAIGDVNVAMTR